LATEQARKTNKMSAAGAAGVGGPYWFGVFAPAKTPKEKVSQLAGWFTAALQAPEFKAKLVPLGLYSVGMCGADFSALLRKQYDDFGRVIREANIK
jgi:tripartite-type tricarboxylate transporter receptor subunit TctC